MRKDVQHIVNNQGQKAHNVQRQHRQAPEDSESEAYEGEASGDMNENEFFEIGEIKIKIIHLYTLR